MYYYFIMKLRIILVTRKLVCHVVLEKEGKEKKQNGTFPSLLFSSYVRI